MVENSKFENPIHKEIGNPIKLRLNKSINDTLLSEIIIPIIIEYKGNSKKSKQLVEITKIIYISAKIIFKSGFKR